MQNAPDLPTLYHAESSFFSQLCRLVLVEKGTHFQSVLLSLSPPDFDNFEPEYIRINNNATVPSLQVGNRVFTDAEHYIYKIDRLFEGPKLAGSNPIATGNWVIRALALSHRDIVALNAPNRFLTLAVNKKRLKRLAERKSQHPDLSVAYAAKIAGIEQFTKAIKDKANTIKVDAQFIAALDAVNKVLTKSPHVSEDNYTIADAVWTAVTARQILLGRAPFSGRPNLEEWFSRMKARPSYTTARIHDHNSLRAKLKILTGLLR